MTSTPFSSRISTAITSAACRSFCWKPITCRTQPPAHARRTAQPQIALFGPHGSGVSRHQGSRPCNFPCISGAGNRPRTDFGALRLTSFHVVHDDRAGPCLGFRFEAEGKVIAFSGDTEWTNTAHRYRARGRPVYLRGLYARQADRHPHGAVLLERHLGQIRPKRLILTHMSNDMLARRAELRSRPPKTA